jgi:arylsulfatase A-like enzyme
MPPNLLLITTDQHRADGLGCYGNPAVRTPNLDRLAREGTRFNRAFVNNPLCMPSRATLLTGRLPRSHRVWCNGIALPTTEVPFPALLGDAGYRTGCVGKMHFTPYGAEARPGYFDAQKSWEAGALDDWTGPYAGFQEVQLTIGHCSPSAGHYGRWLKREFPEAQRAYRQDGRLGAKPASGAPQTWRSTLPVEAHHSTWVADRSLEFLRRHREGPFFLWASFPDPHHPFRPPAAYAEPFADADVPMPLRRSGELDDKPPLFRQYFDGLTVGSRRHEGAGLDHPGVLTDGQLRDIIRYTYGMISLVDTSVGRILDVLDSLGLAENTHVCFASDHGELLGDHGLICKGPFHYDGLIRVPMLWRLAGQECGRVSEAFTSLVDLAPTFLDLAGQPIPGTMQGRSLGPLLAGRTARHREGALVEFQSGYRPWLNLKTWRTADWKLTYYAGQPYGELYDLRKDPGEFVNLYASPAHRGIRAELLERLLEELVLTECRSPAVECHA